MPVKVKDQSPKEEALPHKETTVVYLNEKGKAIIPKDHPENKVKKFVLFKQEKTPVVPQHFKKLDVPKPPLVCNKEVQPKLAIYHERKIEQDSTPWELPEAANDLSNTETVINLSNARVSYSPDNTLFNQNLNPDLKACLAYLRNDSLGYVFPPVGIDDENRQKHISKRKRSVDCRKNLGRPEFDLVGEKVKDWCDVVENRPLFYPKTKGYYKYRPPTILELIAYKELAKDNDVLDISAFMGFQKTRRAESIEKRKAETMPYQYSVSCKRAKKASSKGHFSTLPSVIYLGGGRETNAIWKRYKRITAKRDHEIYFSHLKKQDYLNPWFDFLPGITDVQLEDRIISLSSRLHTGGHLLPVKRFNKKSGSGPMSSDMLWYRLIPYILAYNRNSSIDDEKLKLIAQCIYNGPPSGDMQYWIEDIERIASGKIDYPINRLPDSSELDRELAKELTRRIFSGESRYKEENKIIEGEFKVLSSIPTLYVEPNREEAVFNDVLQSSSYHPSGHSHERVFSFVMNKKKFKRLSGMILVPESFNERKGYCEPVASINGVALGTYST
jgi:hypothetical protein